MALLRLADDEMNGAGKSIPTLEFLRKLLAAGGGEGVELGVTPGCRLAWLRFNPPLLLETMQSGIKRALGNLQDVAAHLLNPLGDRPPVPRLERDGLQNEKVESALNQIGWLPHIPRYLDYRQYIPRRSTIPGSSGSLPNLIGYESYEHQSQSISGSGRRRHTDLRGGGNCGKRSCEGG